MKPTTLAHQPRPLPLTPTQNAAITAQCITRVYDEHDREDEGRDANTKSREDKT